MESTQGPPNLVAKLMGLEALPQQEPDSVVFRNHYGGHSRNCSDVPMSYWEQQDEFFHFLDPSGHKAACKIRQRSQKSTHAARYKETINDRKMGLVRQNFIEAKRLSVNERLRQSKQFQDALEVLSSNKDLFLKCLQEPHSMFPENLYSRQSDSNPPETKRITILRPSKRAENNEFVVTGNEDTKKIKKEAFLQLNGLEKVQSGSSSPESLKYYENPSRPTQIVVLKPTRKKASDDMAAASPFSEQPMMLRREDLFRYIEDDGDQESREVAKEIAQRMHAKFGQHCEDENLISSVLLNDYIGDGSSFNKLEHDYVGDHLCHSEAMSPVSRASGDYVDRLSPYSTSSLSRPSYSPESSVCREAKKRLSERWAMMASNEIAHERRQYQRSSSTLGEMLALTETKPSSSHGEEGSSSQESRDSDFLLVSQWKREEGMDNSARNLMRSKSVPVSGGFGTRLNIGSSVSGEEKSESSKEDTKVNSARSSLKGKVSSLFLSRAKKADKGMSLVSHTKDGFYLYPGDIDRTVSLSEKGSIHASPLLEPSRKASSSKPICMKMMSPENGLVTEKLSASGSIGENLDQPSPVPVLGPSFEEDEYIQKSALYYAKPEQQGVGSPLLSIGSHLIDKSPPIESIARSTSSNDPFVNTDSSHLAKKLTTKETDEEEQECLYFIKALLAEAGHQCEACSTSCLTRCHSLQSPLDLSFRGSNFNFQDDKYLSDAKLRQKRAVQQLVYDCVNAALVDAGYDSHMSQGFNRCIIPNCIILGGGASLTMLDEVWSQMKVWFSSEARGAPDDCGENDSLVVEKVIGKEIEGKGWSGYFRSEIDNLGREIEGRLLEELMQEVVVELAGRA
ncbi:uncharacterized protein LOC131014291 [Salvia miltiorrhiza]|uniref:uncharacterized protein LOC131014291 n=1 Tax=Salvia miltiorrhiza TaxID=226208 RepID=UPI0025AB9907|nr:uncharacterized protein LOC131014291 [Salvia miltiorrhiza]